MNKDNLFLKKEIFSLNQRYGIIIALQKCVYSSEMFLTGVMWPIWASSFNGDLPKKGGILFCTCRLISLYVERFPRNIS